MYDSGNWKERADEFMESLRPPGPARAHAGFFLKMRPKARPGPGRPAWKKSPKDLTMRELITMCLGSGRDSILFDGGVSSTDRRNFDYLVSGDDSCVIGDLDFIHDYAGFPEGKMCEEIKKTTGSGSFYRPLVSRNSTYLPLRYIGCWSQEFGEGKKLLWRIRKADLDHAMNTVTNMGPSGHPLFNYGEIRYRGLGYQGFASGELITYVMNTVTNMAFNLSNTSEATNIVKDVKGERKSTHYSPRRYFCEQRGSGEVITYAMNTVTKIILRRASAGIPMNELSRWLNEVLENMAVATKTTKKACFHQLYHDQEAHRPLC
ncbi:unnamed protein product [Caenorhabditis auriculariae]|uniref:Uncharacterized protein n=1 Tax=Caenorhabditis auriculariae TaxID=2777116 RepID=A0A8S1HY34_9PELO|nr:unnamed protein product [Caenorhabditis auriculariae]